MSLMRKSLALKRTVLFKIQVNQGAQKRKKLRVISRRKTSVMFKMKGLLARYNA